MHDEDSKVANVNSHLRLECSGIFGGIRKVLAVSVLLVTVPFISFAQTRHSPYTGQEKREIKALSPENIEGYLSGEGMGFAKAAELNHYPGPKHVLELADELHLSKAQIDKTKAIFGEMHEKAVSIGKVIVEKEKILDHLFANQTIDEKKSIGIHPGDRKIKRQT